MTTLDLHNRTRQPHPTKGATGMRMISPLSPAERDIVARVVDAAPTLRPTVVAELSALIGSRP